MTGKFTFISETEHATLDWGRVGALCDPSGTGARQLVVLDARLFPGNGHDFHKHVQQEEVILVVTGQIEQWIETEKRCSARATPPSLQRIRSTPRSI